MADIVIGATFALTVEVFQWGIADVAITKGQSVYINPVSVPVGQINLCRKDLTDVEANCQGISINAAAPGQPIAYMWRGHVRLGGGTVSAGQIYIVGNAAGGIAPEGDAIAGEFVTIIGFASDPAQLNIGIHQSGVAHA